MSENFKHPRCVNFRTDRAEIFWVSRKWLRFDEFTTYKATNPQIWVLKWTPIRSKSAWAFKFPTVWVEVKFLIKTQSESRCQLRLNMSPEKEEATRCDPICLKRPEPIGADKLANCEEPKSRKVPKASSPNGERQRLPSNLEQSPVPSSNTPSELHMSESKNLTEINIEVSIRSR